MSKLRALVLGLMLLVALGVGLLVGVVAPRVLSLGWPRPRFSSPATLITQVQGLSHLVTVRYVMEKVIVLEDVRFYGGNRVLLVAHGVVKAGVDLSKIRTEDLQVKERSIAVRLPAAAVTDVYLDEERTEVIEHTTGLLRRFDKRLEQSARLRGLEEIREAARSSGILEDASERAAQQVRVLFQQLGFETVEFR